MNESTQPQVQDAPGPIHLRAGLEWLGSRPLRLFQAFRLTFLFMLLYLLNTLVYVFVFRTPNPSAIDQVLTAAFSPSENFFGYSSANEGLFFNLELELVIIATIEFYVRIARGESRWLDSTDIVFLLGILVSYVMSILLHLTRGFPSSGTTDIGVSISLTLHIFSSRDTFWEMAAMHAKIGDPWSSTLLSYGTGVLSVIYMGGFLVANAGVHLLGLILLAPLFAVTTAVRKLRSDNAGSVVRVYVALVVLVVLITGFQVISQLFQVNIG